MSTTRIPRIPVNPSARWWAQTAAMQFGPERAAKLAGVSRAALADIVASFDVAPIIAAKVERAHDRCVRRLLRAA